MDKIHIRGENGIYFRRLIELPTKCECCGNKSQAIGEIKINNKLLLRLCFECLEYLRKFCKQ